MGLIDVDVDKAGKDAVDELALKVEPILQAAIIKLVQELRALLVGRTITITIT